MSRILVVDDDRGVARGLQLYLETRGHAASTAFDADSALTAVRDQRPELVLLDIHMPGARSGLEVLPEIRAAAAQVPVLVITGHHDMATTIEAIHAGAADYLRKPIDLDELDDALARVLPRPADGQHHPVPQEPPAGHALTGSSRTMIELFKRVALVARGDATVLVTGESGVGKELVARAIHDASPRRENAFVTVNCAAIVDTLLESDLFGHERGSFTGATARHVGRFALAEGGTLFLDEVGEMSPAMQAKLLRALQYKEFTPIGATRARRVDTRIVAATNVDLAARVAQGGFREDLFYRLEVCSVHVPPLRERREDLPALVSALLGRINRDTPHRVTHITRDAMQRLQAHDWRGNVRELENALTEAAALCTSGLLTTALIPQSVLADGPPPAPAAPAAAPRVTTLHDLERGHVAQVLELSGWHRGRACELLGVSRPTLRRMIRDFGLHPPGRGPDPACPPARR